MRASKLAQKKHLNVVGIMSGTSLDGVDFVLARVSRAKAGPALKFQEMASVAFPKKLRSELLAAARHELGVDALARLHFALGRFYASSLQAVIEQKAWSMDLIGLHGQTVFHQGGVASLQIGEPSFLSQVLGLPVVSDFRAADLAGDGQGAPLAPYFHQVAFAEGRTSFAVHNLGGISNLTHFRNGKIIRAFDTGPANMPMDWCLQKSSQGRIPYDANGNRARRGTVHPGFVRQFLRHPFLKKNAPKSCGREEFGEGWLEPLLQSFPSLDLNDQLASLTEGVALSIAQAYQLPSSAQPEEIIFCGGGSKNQFLLSRIQVHLPDIRVVTSDDKGWPAQAIEGAAFALLAAARVWELRLDFRSVTGAQQKMSLGKITDL